MASSRSALVRWTIKGKRPHCSPHPSLWPPLHSLPLPQVLGPFLSADFFPGDPFFNPFTEEPSPPCWGLGLVGFGCLPAEPDFFGPSAWPLRPLPPGGLSADEPPDCRKDDSFARNSPAGPKPARPMSAKLSRKSPLIVRLKSVIWMC